MKLKPIEIDVLQLTILASFKKIREGVNEALNVARQMPDSFLTDNEQLIQNTSQSLIKALSDLHQELDCLRSETKEQNRMIWKGER